VTAQTWASAAKLSSELRKKGITLPMSDIIIAAVALEHNLTIMTEDQHFQQIAGLLLLTE
jgi:predicted nucleic acid-binding protein